MNQIVSAASHDLLACFFEESEKQFRFLEETLGYLYLSGLARYQNNYKIIVPYKQNAADVPFFAVTRYEKHGHAIEILYGDQNYFLDVLLYPDSITRLSLRDIIAASKLDMPQARNFSYLTEKHHVVEALGWFSKTVLINPRILDPSDKMIDRALTMRDKLTEQNIREHFSNLIKDASIRAAEAFVSKNYRKVVELLGPYAAFLSASDLKKFKLAQSKLT